ncbi:hypothetical protein [uncultured Duncaniella sp.]|uniref:hypothetical protein n=1 Tax=uncultured Duncaniella sp. TaxID=2768039 RepID=UPI0025CCADE4|nr:hypothetical protein [uncultured Duncaniella sp.]
MKHRKSNIYISAFCVAAGISSCSTDATMPRAAGETRSVDMQITVSKSTDASRTVIAENDGDLDCLWTAGDRIVVSSTDGTKLGILSLTSGAGESQAVFEGKIEVTEEEGTSTFNFFYFGTETDPESIGSTVMLNYSSQEGTLASLSANDFFSASSNVSIAYGSATAESVVLKRATAFGRFNLQFEGADWSGETVTVSGSGLTNILNVGLDGSITTDNAENATITVANPEADLWLTILPGETDLTFTTTIGEKLYTATLPSRKWTAGEYVRMANADGTISGIPVEMTTEPDPITDPGDAVGPVFEVKDKKFRFTKANLAYNVNEKRWYLLDEQWSFLCKKGWAYANGSYVGTKESDIDLFGFGCTGLHFSYYNDRLQTPTQFEEDINAPEYFIQKTLYAGQSINGTSQGYYYPTQNETCNQGYTGSNLEYGIQEMTMDWGTAYEQQENNGGNYYTLLSSDWSDLQSKYFMTGATITDIANPNNSNKAGLYGCMILDATNKTEASALLKEYGATVSASLSDNLSFTGTNYQYFNYDYVKLTSEQFKALEAAGKVVFLPEAGHTAVTTNSYTKTDGYYWTATAGQAYTSTIFRFDGNVTPKVFKLDTQSSRIFGCAVRLVKEVK